MLDMIAASKKKFIVNRYICIFVITLFANSIFNCNSLIFSLPEFLIVLYYTIKGKFVAAMKYHIIFLITSCGALYNGIENLELYNYAKLKIFSIIPIHFIISFFILIRLVLNKRYKIRSKVKTTDFYVFYFMMKVFTIFGLTFGIIGLILGKYKFDGFLTYGTYSLYIYINSAILVRLFHKNIKDFLYCYTPIFIIISMIPSLITLCSKIEMYSTYLAYFGCLLFLPFIYEKKYKLSLLFFLIYVLCNILIQTSGKIIIQVIILFMIAFALLFSKKIQHQNPFRVKKILYITCSLVLLLPILIFFFGSIFITKDSNFLWKLYSAGTMFAAILDPSKLSEVAPSPYVRLVEFLNIFYEDLYNPLYLFFGRGFGGYYTDQLNLFQHITLTEDAFSKDMLESGVYHYAHDAFVSIPMLHGVLGLFLWLYVIARYVIHSVNNYLKLVAIPFLFLAFYFDSLLGMTAMFLLYASEHKIKRNENIVH